MSLVKLIRSSSMLSRRLHRSYSSSSSSSSSSTKRESFSTKSFLFFGTPVVVTFSLGVWQVKRLFHKYGLIEDRQHRLYGQPMLSNQLFDPKNESDVEFRAVNLRGRFLHDLEMHVSPRSAPNHLPPAVLQWGGSSGLQVVTPCQLDNQRIVLVNRGWIPHRLVEQQKRPTASVSPLPFMVETQTNLSDYTDDTVEFQGVVRNEQERNRFMPNNEPQKNEWFYIDAEQMTKHCKLDTDEQKPFIVELCQPIPSNGWPFPRSLDQFLEFRTPPSTHITYAATWFSLSGALALLMRARLRKA